MITFSNNIKLIMLVSLVNIFAVYCKIDHINTLNCTIIADRMVEINPQPISVINKCAEGYKNQYIIAKCQDLISRELPFDTDLFRPVISVITNATYWNKFCATCNNDNETNWHFSLAWDKQESLCENLIPRIRKSEVDDIRELTRIFIQKGLHLTAKFFEDPRELECSMEGDWPVHLLYYVTPCLIENFLISQRNRSRSCQYAEKTGRICTNIRPYMEGFSLVLKNNDVIEYDDKLSEFRFTRGEYFVETGFPNVFYVCEEPVTTYGTNHQVKIGIVCSSIIVIVIGFGVQFYKRYLQQNIAKELVAWYLVGSIPLSVELLFIYLLHPVPCVAFRLAQFLWVHHFFWTMLSFGEFFYPACIFYFGKKIEISLLPVKYLGQCIFGFVIPLALPIIYHFGVLVKNENYKEDISQMSSLHAEFEQYSCPVIPDHSAVSCTPYRNSGAEYYTQWLKDILYPTFNIFIPVLIFAVLTVELTHWIYYFLFRVKLASHNNPKKSFTGKMAIIMSIHWIPYMIYRKHGGDDSYKILGLSLNTICQLSIDFHYVIILITSIVCGITITFSKKSYKFKQLFINDGGITIGNDVEMNENSVRIGKDKNYNSKLLDTLDK